jgi:hypothetical protein
MYEKVICRNCEGNGCGSCHKTGVKFVEVDEIDQRYYDNIIVDLSNNNSQLKKQLEIAKKALLEINCSDEAIFDKWVTSCELRNLARQALKQLESAGE